MTDNSELKRLAEAATPGPWEIREAEGMGAIAHPHGWVLDGTDEEELADKRFIAAANPAAVLALLAENERLQHDIDCKSVITGDYVAACQRLQDERDQLKAEVEALRKDAERLDWLADPDNQSGTVQLPVVCVLRNVHSLRDAIDDAMSLEAAR